MEPISNSVRGVIGVRDSRSKTRRSLCEGLFTIGDGHRHARQVGFFHLAGNELVTGGMRPVCVP